VSIEGSAAPSAIVEAIQSTGRDAILRGSGKSNSTCAQQRYLQGIIATHLLAVIIGFSWPVRRCIMLMRDLQALLYAY
jgi:hypothetical protein